MKIGSGDVLYWWWAARDPNQPRAVRLKALLKPSLSRCDIEGMDRGPRVCLQFDYKAFIIILFLEYFRPGSPQERTPPQCARVSLPKEGIHHMRGVR